MIMSLASKEHAILVLEDHEEPGERAGQEGRAGARGQPEQLASPTPLLPVEEEAQALPLALGHPAHPHRLLPPGRTGAWLP